MFIAALPHTGLCVQSTFTQELIFPNQITCIFSSLLLKGREVIQREESELGHKRAAREGLWTKTRRERKREMGSN